MKNKYKLLSLVMVFTLAVAIACVPAMAYQMSNIAANEDEPIEVVDSQIDQPVDSSVYEQSSDYVDSQVEYSSTEPIESDTTVDSSYVDSSYVDSSTDVESEYESDVISLDSSEPAEPSFDDGGDGYVESIDYDYNYNQGTYQEGQNNAYYSEVTQNTRSVITGDTWSTISLDLEEDSETGSVVVKNTGKGDFSFIKENDKKSDSSLYYWLAGGIASIVVGLCGISFVLVMAYDKSRKAKLAAAKARRSFKRGDTADVVLPDENND
ncbi:MAG: hypothetical protein PUC88_02445 [Clostridia bacterium]|nr:hypothetical protein [Clostridia bacterium]